MLVSGVLDREGVRVPPATSTPAEGGANCSGAVAPVVVGVRALAALEGEPIPVPPTALTLAGEGANRSGASSLGGVATRVLAALEGEGVRAPLVASDSKSATRLFTCGGAWRRLTSRVRPALGRVSSPK